MTNTSPSIPPTPLALLLNTVSWGFVLWLFGYLLGFVFYAFVPKDAIGWYILPFGVSATLWVLFKKIARKSFGCYIGLALFWTAIALLGDYLFIVKLLNSTAYYKPDVYVYYALTFALPIAVGWYTFKRKTEQA